MVERRRGYLTVDPSEAKLVVSKRIREEFENRRDYYQLHGRSLRLQSDINVATHEADED
jgi:hypothetical protein